MGLTTRKDRAAAAPASKLEEYRSRVRIDRNSLDIDAEEHPQLFLDVANEHVYAQSRHDAARDELLRVDAELGRTVRARMVAEGDKPTEGKVADSVLGEQRHLDAAKKVADAKVELDEWSALRSAFEHRKSMIRELATLYASGYYTAGTAGGARHKVAERDYGAGKDALARSREERGGR